MLVREIVDHILWMKERDIDYAREAAKWYIQTLDWLEISKELRVFTDRQLDKKDQNHPT